MQHPDKKKFTTSSQEADSGLGKNNCMGSHVSTGGDSSGNNGVFRFRDPVTGTKQGGHVIPIVQNSQVGLGISIERAAFCKPFNNSSNVLNCMRVSTFQKTGKKPPRSGFSWVTNLPEFQSVPLDVTKTLGLQVDLRQSDQHEAFIGHTESRVAELTVLLQDIIDAGRINAKHAESLRGRMLWFETYAFGRVGNSAVKKLGDLAYLGVKDVSLKPNDIAAIKFLKDRVLKAPPVRINTRSLESWIIFVDGACEGEDRGVGTIGAVLSDPWGRFLHHFSEVVPASFMERCSYSKNPIYELEILPQLVSLLCWGQLLAQSQCVFYGDNDAARSSLIAGRAATLVASEFVEKEMGLQIKPWFARVPTSSNIADDPSRLSEDVVKSLGSTKTVVAWDEVMASMEHFVHIQSGVRDG